jgi:AraC family transcriptional regulator
VFAPNEIIHKHFHDRAVIGVTLKGEWDSVLGATRLANTPGMLHVEPAGDSHVNHFCPAGTRVILIQPNATYETLLHPFRTLLSTAAQVNVGGHGLRIVECLQTELFEPDELSTLAIEGLATELLILASRATRTPDGSAPAWLVRTVERVHEKFLERPSLTELSEAAGVTPEHFCREFRRIYRVGVAEYMRRLRLDWAADCLRQEGDSVAEIATAAGFSDQSHFTRRFRRHFGITPAAFRRGRKPSN